MRIEDITPYDIAVASGVEGAQRREGQQKTHRWVLETLASQPGPSKDLQIQAPVGVGKSYAYLLAAAQRWLRYGERSIVATSGITLQNQLIEKDLPGLNAALAKLCGRGISYELMKGRTNYRCACAAERSAADHLKMRKADARQLYDALVQRNDKLSKLLAAALSKEFVDRDEAVSLIGDRSFVEEHWEKVSSETSDDCSREDCAYRKARDAAAVAGIVVTNHAQLGMRGVGRSKLFSDEDALGRFDHVIVDEAHSFAANVRDRDESSMSLSSAKKALKAFEDEVLIHFEHSWAHQSEYDDAVAQLSIISKSLTELFSELSVETSQWPESVESRDVDNLVPGQSTDLGDIAAALRLSQAVQRLFDGKPGSQLERFNWAKQGAALIDLLDIPLRERQKAKRKLNRAIKAVSTVGRDALAFSWHSPGLFVRSLRFGERGLEMVLQRVDVSRGLRELVWTGRYERSAVCVSGTLPQRIRAHEELGMECLEDASNEAGGWRSVGYPYQLARSASAVYMPDLSEEQLRPLLNRFGKLDASSEAFRQYVADQAEALVRANQGSALVVCSNRLTRNLVLQRLRAADLGVAVYDQSDENAIERWRDDVSAVLVGVKSLEQGVDGRMDTNTLVIMDKAPRVPPDSALSLARAEALQVADPAISDREAADRIFAGDAAVRMGQAAGRLLRTQWDSGMLAVLDPRFATQHLGNGYHLRRLAGGLDYASAWRTDARLYAEALFGEGLYGELITALDEAEEFLVQHRQFRQRLAAV